MRVVFFSTLGLLAAPTAQAADEAPAAQRLDREAMALFEAVINDLQTPPGACDIDTEWSRYPVDDDAKLKAVGRDPYDDNQKLGLVGTPREIIGPVVAKDVPCDDAARKRLQADRIVAWQAAFHALPAGAKRPPMPMVCHRSFSFPIFDRMFRHAVFVRQSLCVYANFDEKGVQRKYSPLEGSGWVLVYKKGATGWQKVDEINQYYAD